MKVPLRLALFFNLIAAAHAQIQVELRFPRLQYVAHEPVMASIKITNLAGRDIDLRDESGRRWFGFEVNAGEGRLLAPLRPPAPEAALHVEAGKTVTRKINLTPEFPVHDPGAYHVRANIFFADLNKFFYSPTKVFQVTDARPIWQRTVGIPEGAPGAGEERTYSLLSNRFPDHTSLYVRVEEKGRGIVYATYSLGRALAYDEPQAELDHENQLHVLHCAAPRSWAYSHIGLNGELLAHSTFMETKTRPRLRHTANGAVAVSGGMQEVPGAQPQRGPETKSAARPAVPPVDH
ncbi:MAG: hypothetical protein DMF06_01340 [Verrucomicrobia bacterium]|nr:MAG: hypothetical protein DMF06_01340 [Verrucomicrobiota bacterium]